MNWIQRKIYLYNVTFGLYMLDWWERFLFNTLMIVLLWFICYNGSRSMADFYRRICLLMSTVGSLNHDLISVSRRHKVSERSCETISPFRQLKSKLASGGMRPS